MKKHRKFLILYSLWSISIIFILVAFDATPDQNLNASSKSLCMTNDRLENSTTNDYQVKLCCLDQLKNTTAQQ